MAIIQISKIQQRRGKRDDIPESLPEGQFAFTTDTGEVFIGAPNLDKIQHRRLGTQTPTGIFPYSNVKLLTEFDVSYTLSEEVYTNGPLLSGSVPNTVNQTIDLTQVGTPTGNLVTFSNVFTDDQTGAYISNVSIQKQGVGLFVDYGENFAFVDKKNLILDRLNTDPTFDDTDVVRVEYFEAYPLIEFALNEADSMIIQYSAMAEDAWPVTGYLTPKPRITGTLLVSADPVSVAVKNDFVELNSFVGSLNLKFSGRIIGTQGNEVVQIVCANSSLQQLHFKLNGNRWSSSS